MLSRPGFAFVVSAVLFALGIYAVVAFAIDVYRYNKAINAEAGDMATKLANTMPITLQPGEKLSFTFKEKYAIFIKSDLPLSIESYNINPFDWYFSGIVRVVALPNKPVLIMNRYYDKPVSLSAIAIPIEHIKPPEIGFLYIAIILFIMALSICLYIDKKMFNWFVY